MLQSPIKLHKSKSSWKKKLRYISVYSSKKESPESTIQRTPHSFNSLSLSSSQTSTPNTYVSSTTQSDYFLTPLEVLDDDGEFNGLLENQVGMVFGDFSIPPPPPRRKSSPTLKVLPIFQEIPGPKIKPFFTTASKKDYNPTQQVCFICQDVLGTKLHSEKLIPLNCGDCVHSACLHTKSEILLEEAVNSGKFSANYSQADVEAELFPICQGQCCERDGRHAQVSLLESDIASEMVADAMLTVKIAHLSSPTFKQPVTFGEENRVSRYYFRDNDSLKPKSNLSETLDTKNMHIMPSQSVAEIPSDCERENTQHFLNNMQISLEDMKDMFIRHMVRKYSEISLATLVSLGTLRIVDRLYVSFEDEPFVLKMVYLFSNFILVGMSDSSPTLISLNDTFTITTPGTSVIQFSSTKKDFPTLRLHSDVGAIIEKWGIALSDVSILLPSDLITSSISLLELEQGPQNQYTGTNIYPESQITVDKDQRYSSVSIIEPREILDIQISNFEKALMDIGVLSSTKVNFDTKPISPLNITKNLIAEETKSLCTSELTSDQDSDSDSELICEVIKNQKIER